MNAAVAPSRKALLKSELARFGRFMLQELKPKGKVFTPFNIITGGIMLLAAALLAYRFWKGIGSITNLNQDYPWGFWIGFDVVTGVAFAGGAYVVTFMVYILGQEKYHPIVRATVLNGFLAYVFYAGALLLDLGRPWNVVNPIIGNSFGVSSVLFLVAWHFMLYMMAQFVEFSPAVAEWLGWRRVRVFLGTLTAGAVIFGITLSLLHQSGLGALYLMARDKVHPLWYTEFIPILFVASSIFAGLSMVIFEGSLSHKVFHHRVGRDLRKSHDAIVISLARICGATMFVYLFLKLLVFVHGQRWVYLFSGWGAWWTFEMVGLVALPALMFLYGNRTGNLRLIKLAAIATLIGIIINRLNVTVIGFKWDAPVRYIPSWMEIEVTLAVLSAEVWVFRWIVNRMPVLGSAVELVREPARAPQPHAPAA